MAKFKHFTLEERVSIEIMLKASLCLLYPKSARNCSSYLNYTSFYIKKV